MEEFSPASKKWTTALFGLIITFAAFALLANSLTSPPSVSAYPQAQATPTPTCPPQPPGCPQPRVRGYQPPRPTIAPTFDSAATNSLGSAGPTYDQIRRGICPNTTPVTVSPSNPIPSVILKAIGLQESSWRQFDADGDYETEWDCTLVSGSCGYGIMQMTSCMSTGCGWFTPSRVAGEIAYNVGTGTNFLIRDKWNLRSAPTCRQIGENNHVKAEDWYYAVTSYGPGGWSNYNNPNNTARYLAERPPYLEGDYVGKSYPYQEYIWGHMAHPSSLGGQQWWIPQRIPWVPRGIFGPDSETGWQPATWTPRPTFYYLPDIKANYNGWNSYIVLQNTHGDLTLAADIALYNQDGTFRKWWLNPDNSPVRLAPHASRTLSVADRFSGSSFNGSAVIAASQDVSVIVENQYGTSRSYAYNGIAASDPLNPGWGQVGTTLYAPVIMRNYYGWYSELVLLNAGSATASGNIEYYRSTDGQKVDTVPFSLPPNGSLSTYYSGGAENTLYSARILSLSAQPLAAVVRQYKFNPYVSLAYNCFSAGASSVYAPLIMNNYYGWDTSVNIQNTADFTATVSVQYYNTSGYQVGETPDDEIPPYASRSRYSPSEGLPDDFIGTARISSGQPVAVIVNQSSPHGDIAKRGMSYNGTSTGSTYVVLPDVLNYYGSEKWVSSVNVRNLSSCPDYVTLSYQGLDVTRLIYGKCLISFYLPDNWGMDSLRGPATVSSYLEPMAVVVNHASVISTTVDLARSYNGYNR